MNHGRAVFILRFEGADRSHEYLQRQVFTSRPRAQDVEINVTGASADPSPTRAEIRSIERALSVRKGPIGRCFRKWPAQPIYEPAFRPLDRGGDVIDCAPVDTPKALHSPTLGHGRPIFRYLRASRLLISRDQHIPNRLRKSRLRGKAKQDIGYCWPEAALFLVPMKLTPDFFRSLLRGRGFSIRRPAAVKRRAPTRAESRIRICGSDWP
jgi:hypothetical protein